MRKTIPSNKEKAKFREQTPLFMYYKVGPQPVTVCLLVQNGGRVTARGVAVCSVNDPFSKKKGRDIAFGRATRAWEYEEDGDQVEGPRPSGPDLVILLMQYNDEFSWKSKFMPKLTDIEDRIVAAFIRGREKKTKKEASK